MKDLGVVQQEHASRDVEELCWEVGGPKRVARAGSGGGGGMALPKMFEDGRRRLRHGYMKGCTVQMSKQAK